LVTVGHLIKLNHLKLVYKESENTIVLQENLQRRSLRQAPPMG